MSISVDIDLEYQFGVKAPAKDVMALLSDVPASVSHFPKVDKLVDLGDGVYRWEMQKVGTAQVKLQTVKKLAELAEGELGCSVSALALAWVACRPTTSTVILGVSKPEQILQNLKALEVLPKLTPDVLEKIEAILQNKPVVA